MTIVRRIAEPVTEPITLEEAKRHLRVDDIDSDGHPDDDLILGLIGAAREHCENFTGRALALTDFEVVLDAWPDEDDIELPFPPFIGLLNGVTISDEVSDNAIDEDLYSVDDFTGLLPIISPVSVWPTLSTGNRIRVRYRAGYGDESEAAGHLPKSIKAAMLLMLGHLYANREAVGDAQQQELPLGVEALLRPYQVRRGFA